MTATKKYRGVDFDGTLSQDDPGAPLATHLAGLGPPVPAMLERVKRWLADKEEVRIITARVAPIYADAAEQTAMIQAWCQEHLGAALPVQSYKCGGMSELWDDRAVRVLRNTGRDELAEAYNEIFWTVPESMPLVEKIKVLKGMEADALVDGQKAKDALKAVYDYDERYEIESDAYADFEPELVAEDDGKYRYTIFIEPVVHALIPLHKDMFYVDAREARVLAAKLLKAADLDDAARGVCTR